MTACSSEKLSQKVHLSTCDLCQRFECRRCFPKHVLIGANYDFRFRFFLSSLLINQSAEGAGISYVIKYWIRNYYRKNKWPSVNAILTEVTRSCVREGEHVAEHVTVEQCGGCRSYLTKVFQRWRLSPWGGWSGMIPLQILPVPVNLPTGEPQISAAGLVQITALFLSIGPIHPSII